VFAYLYKHWAYMCLPIALFCSFILICSWSTLSLAIFLIWLHFPLYLLHQFEEHAYPGGFKHFVNQYIFHREGTDLPLNDISIFWMHTTVIWILFPLFAALAQLVNPAYGAFLPYFSLFNATTHGIIAIMQRRYHPGLIVSIFLNYPCSVYTLHIMRQAQLMTVWGNAIAWTLTLSIHAFILGYALAKTRDLKKTRT